MVGSCILSIRRLLRDQRGGRIIDADLSSWSNNLDPLVNDVLNFFWCGDVWMVRVFSLECDEWMVCMWQWLVLDALTFHH